MDNKVMFKGMVDLEKRADLSGAVGTGIGLMAGSRIIDAASNKISKHIDSMRFKSIISHAKRENPELRKRSEKTLETWMEGIYAISPKIATNKALASSALLTIDSYNGNFDLATAKILADVNRGSSASDNRDTALSSFSAASHMN